MLKIKDLYTGKYNTIRNKEEIRMEKVILFGASNLGETAYDLLKSKFEICYFSDNDLRKWGKTFCNVTIIEPAKLKISKEYNEYKVIITSMYFLEILRQLIDMGLYNINIFFIDYKNPLSYKIIDMEEYAYENLNINVNFKKEYIDDFSLLYNTEKINGNRIQVNTDLKRVLIIAYFFPPLGGAGVQRTLKFVKYLREFGWEPIVITCGDNEYDVYDSTLSYEIPKGVNIIRIDDNLSDSKFVDKKLIQQNINLYYGLVEDEVLIYDYIAQFKSISTNEIREFILPDKYIRWANEVLKSLENIIDISNIDLIYSTGSPYSDHIIGYYLKKKYNKPWVTDFRDEWTNNGFSEYVHTSLKYRIEYELEKKIVNLSDKVLVTTPVSKQNYIEIFNLNSCKTNVITNGFDEEDFKDLKKNSKNKRFKIIHNGSLYGKRIPDIFIQCIYELINDKLINENEIEVIFIGSHNINIQQLNEYNLFNNIKFISYRDHAESLKLSNEADVLLLIVGNDENCIQYYPGKMFEYFRLGKSIISLSPTNSATSRLLSNIKRGYNIEYSDLEGIKNVILKLFNDWKNDILIKYPVDKTIKKFDRKHLTEQLAKIFDELVNN